MKPFVVERAAEPLAAVRLARRGVTEGEAVPARFIAGGTTLIDLMKLGVERPARLVDLGSLRSALGFIMADDKGLRLGALVRMSEAAEHPVVRAQYPVISQALLEGASPQIRNMASLGGNVLQRTRCSYFRDTGSGPCNKRDPGSGCAALGGVTRALAVLGVSDHCIANYPGDLAVALVALDAKITIIGHDGVRRTIPFEQLHLAPGSTPHVETTLQPGELITEFRIPASPWTWRSLYLKVRDRESYAFALVSVALAADLAPDGTVHAARIALGGLAARPWRAHQAEAALLGRPLDAASAAATAEIAFSGCLTDMQTAFKPAIGRRLLAKGLLALATKENAQGGRGLRQPAD